MPRLGLHRQSESVYCNFAWADRVSRRRRRLPLFCAFPRLGFRAGIRARAAESRLRSSCAAPAWGKAFFLAGPGRAQRRKEGEARFAWLAGFLPSGARRLLLPFLQSPPPPPTCLGLAPSPARMLLARGLRCATAAALRPLQARPLQLRAPRLASPIAASAAARRPFTRSLWLLGGQARGPGLLRGSPASLSCGCGGLHTEGDKAFAEFLTDEIKEEKKIQKHQALPKMSGGWELSIHGTEAKLVRKVAGETVTVSFNINNSIPPSFDEPQEGQKPQEPEAELTSTPNFVVEVTKDDTKQTLVLDCHYPEDEVGHGDEEESDIFSIQEVSFQPPGDSEWRENSYTLNTDSLDWALYDHLMDFLADRGVDNTFADELVVLSTALEHKEYIQFLEDLKHFVKCQ